jgi:uncharacterized protein YbjT (DUF2867 family)
MGNTLVIGATGKVGRQVTTALLRDGHPVRAVSRHPEGAPAGAEPAVFDWQDRATWAPVVDGVEALFVVGPYQTPEPGTVLAEFLAGATSVQRVVLLSSMATTTGDGSTNGVMEDAVRESGKDWVVLRSSWFIQNFTENPAFTLGIRERGELIASLDDTPVSFVDTRDLGDLAASLLVGDNSHLSAEVLDVTGPEAMTMAAVAAELTRATGREIRYLRPSPPEAAERLVEVGLPPFVTEVLVHVDAATRSGSFTPVTDTVPRLLGRAARDLASFAAEMPPA